MPLTSFCDGRVLGERVGTDPRVLALHGWGRDRRNFTSKLGDIGAITVDLPGFGSSPAPDEPWGSADYADALAPLLSEFEEPPVVVGHSFGGRVAVHLADRHGELVRALVLSGVPLLRRAPARRRSLRFRALRTLHRVGIVTDARMEKIRNRHGSADYRAASGVMRQVLVRVVNESYEEQLARLRCPVELVWGEVDESAPVDVARRAAELLGDAPMTVIPGGDHDACFRRPDVLQAAIRRQLS